MPQRNEENRPLTLGGISKWIALISLIAGPSLTAILWGANVNGRITSVEMRIDSNKRERELRDELHEKQIAEAKSKQEQMDKTLVDIHANVRLLLANFDRLDKKLDRLDGGK